MKQHYFLLSIGIVITIGIAICFLQMKQKEELFDVNANNNTNNNTNNTADNNANNTADNNLNPPYMQHSYGIGGDQQALIFWNSKEDKTHPINYFIIQYYKVTGDSRIIHSKLVPKKREIGYTSLIKGLKNNVQYLFQVVGVNSKGIGKLEEGNILLTEVGSKLFE